ncbi:MAG: LysM peptidoglycan-binding domain-containing protein [Candidatus Margulisiibacteriota bacterium]|nr:LysM peptidoglycan-binding domain-containing protein [Candidatus Margulisiibacteriota bacterium]
MIVKFFLLFVCSFTVFADVTLVSPINNQQVDTDVIQFNFESDVETGFYLFGNQIVPIRKRTTIVGSGLTYGFNDFFFSILDSDRRLVTNSNQKITLYRHLPIFDEVSSFEAFLLTELAINYNVHMVVNKKAELNAPILKRDLYAILVWFLANGNTNITSTQLNWQYDDMKGYEQYLDMYRLKARWIPRPVNDNFYPNSLVTRDEFINALLTLKNGQDQISTSMHIKKQLVIPDELRDVVPNSWTKPLSFVTKKEAINIIFNYVNFDFNNDVQPLVVKYDPIKRSTFNLKNIVASTAVLKKKNDGVLQPSNSKQKNRSLFNVANIRKRFSNRRSDVATNQIVSQNTEENPPADVVQYKSDLGPENKKTESELIIEVQPGDTIQKIAKRHYGKSAKWQFIVENNNLEVKTVTINGQIVSRVHIVPGQRLTLTDL